MYYVIKKQPETPFNSFIGFKAPKYIAAKNNEHVIFEFVKDGKTTRKWIKKEEIILLTDDKKFFVDLMDKFKAVESTQQKLVDEAKSKLTESVETFTEVIDAQINEFNEIRGSDDVPCILKKL